MQKIKIIHKILIGLVFYGSIVCLLVLISIGLTSCGNKALIDTQYTFNYAYIQLQDGTVIQGKVDK